MPKTPHDTIETMRHVAEGGSMTPSQQKALREAVRSGTLDGTPDVKDAIGRRAEGRERSGDLQTIGQHVHRISPKYDD